VACDDLLIRFCDGFITGDESGRVFHPLGDHFCSLERDKIQACPITDAKVMEKRKAVDGVCFAQSTYPLSSKECLNDLLVSEGDFFGYFHFFGGCCPWLVLFFVLCSSFRFPFFTELGN
jgi:hypothetical protein